MTRPSPDHSSPPILSIVVPTKDRFDTLSVLITYVLGWKRDDVSIVVHDNSGNNDEMLAYLKAHGPDPRLIYVHDPTPMSMVDNFNGAMANAKGEYVCLLGDDDGLVESTVDFCHWAKRNGYDSATFDRARYDWPDLQTPSTSGVEAKDGALVVPQFGGQVREVGIRAERKRYLDAAVTNYKNVGPAPYNGIVARQVFEETKAKTGSYFPGTTPGMAAAISALLAAKRHVHVGIPLICGGHSFKSAAGLGRRGQHIGEIKDVKSLASDTVDLWSPELPLFWSGFTINAESALQTLNAWDRPELHSEFNFNRVLAACLIYLPLPYRIRTLRHIGKTRSVSRKITFLGVGKEILRIQLTRARNLLLRKAVPSARTGHATIAGALDQLQSQITAQLPAVKPNSDMNILVVEHLG